MFPKAHYIKGFLKNLFSPRISSFAIISSTVQLDKTTCIYRGVKAKNSVIGDHTYIAAYTEIENAEIGKYCSVADHCRIGMSGHSLQYLSTSPIFTQKVNALQESWIDKDIFVHKSEEERVIIGNDVWVGSHVLINGGVHIGNGAVIGVGAVVVKNVPPYAIVGGVPARIIKYRFNQEVINTIEDSKWWNLSEERLKNLIVLFQQDLNNVEDIRKLFSDYTETNKSL